jgi:hypothetical protein
MAEFLIYAKSAHWMDDKPEIIASCEKTYAARIKLGDIVVVREDGWAWGSCECLPSFLVVKVPGLAVDAKYEQPLYSKTFAPGAEAIVESVYIQEERRFQLVPDAVQGTVDELHAEQEANKADIVQSVIEIDQEAFTEALMTKINEFDQSEFRETQKVS